MRYFLSVSLVLSSIFACTKNTVKLSMPTTKLVSILADIHFAEGIVTNLSVQKRDSIMPIYHKQIFAIHQVSEEQFLNDLESIKQEPVVMSKIYKMVDDTLSARIKILGG